MKNLKKILAVVMAVAMLFALGLNAFAATSDPYLVVGPNTLYSTSITANNSETLTVTTANAYWQRTGFDSLADAASGVTAQVTEGVGRISIGTIGSTTESGFYVTTIPVTATSNAYGPSSIHVTKTADASSYIDLTVYVEAGTVQGPATGIEMFIYDSEYNSIDQYVDDFDVYAATDYTEYSANIFEGMNASAQSYPTVGDSLANYAEEFGFYISANDGYIQKFGYNANTQLVAYWDNNYVGHGWNYAVIRNNALVDDGSIFSASVAELQSGDVVLWVYGTTADLNAYISDYLSA